MKIPASHITLCVGGKEDVKVSHTSFGCTSLNNHPQMLIHSDSILTHFGIQSRIYIPVKCLGFLVQSYGVRLE